MPVILLCVLGFAATAYHVQQMLDTAMATTAPVYESVELATQRSRRAIDALGEPLRFNRRSSVVYDGNEHTPEHAEVELIATGPKGSGA